MDWLTMDGDVLEARIASLFQLARRATLPRLSAAQRRRMEGEAGPARGGRARALAYASLMERCPHILVGAGLDRHALIDLVSKDILLDGLIRSSRQAARSARNGRLLLGAAMAALNARVLLAIERRLADEGTPAEERQRLRACRSAASGEGGPARAQRADRRRQRLEDTLRRAMSHPEVHRLLVRAMGGAGSHLRVLPPAPGKVAAPGRQREEERA